MTKVTAIRAVTQVTAGMVTSDDNSCTLTEGRVRAAGLPPSTTPEHLVLRRLPPWRRMNATSSKS